MLSGAGRKAGALMAEEPQNITAEIAERAEKNWLFTASPFQLQGD
jgi:hypothetical protein